MLDAIKCVIHSELFSSFLLSCQFWNWFGFHFRLNHLFLYGSRVFFVEIRLLSFLVRVDP